MKGHNMTGDGEWEDTKMHFEGLECHVKSGFLSLFLFNMHMNHVGIYKILTLIQ